MRPVLTNRKRTDTICTVVCFGQPVLLENPCPVPDGGFPFQHRFRRKKVLKGDLKKQAILDTADRLFFEKGYTATTIDDILASLGCSKGSLYHHFESKQQILRELCLNRTAMAFASYRGLQGQSTLDALNSLIYFGLPVRAGEERFLSMLIPLVGSLDGSLMIYAINEAQEKQFKPEILRLLLALREEKLAYWRLDGLPSLVWDTYTAVYGRLLDFADKLGKGACQPAEILAILDSARFIWERVLDVPFGSIEIIRAEEALNTIHQALKHNRYLHG